MKGIDSTGAPLVHVPGWMGGWMGGWVEVKAVLRIAYSNQKKRLASGQICINKQPKPDLRAWASACSIIMFTTIIA